MIPTQKEIIEAIERKLNFEYHHMSEVLQGNADRQQSDAEYKAMIMGMKYALDIALKPFDYLD